MNPLKKKPFPTRHNEKTIHNIKFLFMKNYILPLAIVATCIAGSCNNAANTDNQTDSANVIRTDTSGTLHDTTSVRPDTTTYSQQPLDENSRKFITEATSGGMLEVRLGNIAQENGSNPRVKEFGAMMIKDHTDATNQLKSIAKSLNVNVTDSLMKEHQRHVDKMSKMKGKSFDKAYMSMMVDDHKKDIKEFEKASKSSNTSVSNFASQTLPVLNKHLDSAQAINKKL